MNIEELKHLIPLYVAGTLSPEEKDWVEQELKTSEELQQEVSFWLHASVAAQSHFTYLAEGHLPSETITAYAEGRIGSPNERQMVETHIRQCESCREEVELLKQTLVPTGQKQVVPLPEPGFLEQLLGKFFKPALAFSVVVIAAFIFVLVINRKPEFVRNTAFLTLEYQTIPRDPGKNHLPVLSLTNEITNVTLTLIIENPSQPTWYNILLVPSIGAAIPLDTLRTFTQKGKNVQLQVDVPLHHFSSATEQYTMSVHELSPTGDEQFEGEIYEMQFRVVRK